MASQPDQRQPDPEQRKDEQPPDEQYLKDSGLGYTILMPNLFMEI